MKAKTVIDGYILTITEKTTDITYLFDIREIPLDIIHRLAMQGLRQVLSDVTLPYTGEQANETMKRYWQNLKNGKWGMKQSELAVKREAIITDSIKHACDKITKQDKHKRK